MTPTPPVSAEKCEACDGDPTLMDDATDNDLEIRFTYDRNAHHALLAATKAELGEFRTELEALLEPVTGDVTPVYSESIEQNLPRMKRLLEGIMATAQRVEAFLAAHPPKEGT